MGFLSGIFGKVPILGDVAKGIDNTLGRPGDLWNNPASFLSSAAMGASPFLAGPLAGALGTDVKLPSWASTLMNVGQMAGGANQTAPWLNAAMGAYGLLGGPRYPDNGMGDRALGYADQLGLAGNSMLNNAMGDFADPTEWRRRDPNAGAMDFLQGAGMNYLQQGAQLPQLSQMGALGNMQGIMGQMASQAGVANPFTGEGGGTDPYALRPHEQEYYNTQGTMAAQGERAAIGNLRQRLAARGINDPRVAAAAEAQIRGNRTNSLMGTHAGLANQAFQNRQQTLGQFGQMMPSLYQFQNQRQQQNLGQGMNFLDYGNRLQQQGRDDLYRRMGIGQSMLSGPMQAYENAAQRAIGTNRDAAASQASNLRLLASPWMQGNPYGNLFGQQQMPPVARPTGVPAGVPAPSQNVGTPWQDFTPLDTGGMPYLSADQMLNQFNQGWQGAF